MLSVIHVQNCDVIFNRYYCFIQFCFKIALDIIKSLSQINVMRATSSFGGRYMFNFMPQLFCVRLL